MKTFLLFFGAGWLVYTNVLAQTPTVTRGPYLQMNTPVSSVQTGSMPGAITVRWRTSSPTKGRIHYGTQLGSLTAVATETTTSTDHTLRLTPLLPNQRYFYSIEAAEPFAVLEASANHFFTTPPQAGVTKKTRIWVLGDFGNETTAPQTPKRQQDSVIVAIQDFMQQNATGPMDLWLWLGDNAYDAGTDAEYQTSIFNKTWARYDWAFRQTPFYATPGNHEYKSGPPSLPSGERYDRANHQIHYYDVVSNFKNAEAGGEPSGTERYFSFNHSNIHFISLDTYGTDKPYATKPEAKASILAPTSQQGGWLRRDLTKAQADPAIHWIIVFTHMPPYTGGTHDSDADADDDNELGHVRRNLIPLLDSFKVDLVLTGHSHAYERSRLMRGHTGKTNTFQRAIHNDATGSNARSSGRNDGLVNSCFYYKNSKASKNEGIVYAVNGAGGRDENRFLTRFKNRPLTDSIMQVASTKGGSMYLEVNGKRLDVKYITADANLKGQVIDQFTIFKDLEGFTVPPTDGTARTATCECTEDVGQHSFTHYTDQQANLLLSIKKLGKDIGTVGKAPFELKLQGSPGLTTVGSYAPTNYVRTSRVRSVGPSWRVMNRYWTLKPGVELSGNAQAAVRHYYKKTDVLAFNVGVEPDANLYHDNLKFYKINDPSAILNPGNHNAIPRASAFNKTGAWVYDHTSGGGASTLAWQLGHLGNEHFYGPNTDSYFGEIVVGRLGGSGGLGGHYRYLNPTGDLQLLLSGVWRYLATGNAPPSVNWKGGGSFDDSAWREGRAPLGYSTGGVDLERTRIPRCAAELPCLTQASDGETVVVPGCFEAATCPTKWITTYFRTTRRTTANPFYKSYIISYRRDDGVVIYINGKELLPRDPNMRPHPEVILASTLASQDASPETEWVTVVVPNDGSYFQAGENVVAAEVHQVLDSSSDLAFDLEIIASPDVATVPARLAAELWTPAQDATAVVMHPNPADGGKVHFSPPLSYQTLQLTDVRGVVLRYLAQPGTLHEFDLSALPSGEYYLLSRGIETSSRFKIFKP
ncbi:MAG: metallophosphoesterase [Cytophagaceae bacterium]|nr:metallophosphoesterase [Cytophagaceae bacterium]